MRVWVDHCLDALVLMQLVFSYLCFLFCVCVCFGLLVALGFVPCLWCYLLVVWVGLSNCYVFVWCLLVGWLIAGVYA